MPRGRTIGELRWLDTPDFVEEAKKWKENAISILLSSVWEAYDVFCREVLVRIDMSKVDMELERGITQELEVEIHKVMTGFEPFQVQHESYELESRRSHRPPQYDLAFVWLANRRVMWPLEAKVLRTDRSVSRYVKDLKDGFLTCYYAPFSSEGAMLGYLLSGVAAIAFGQISASVPCKLLSHADFPARDHKVSEHERTVPAGKSYPKLFRCHHLILRMV